MDEHNNDPYEQQLYAVFQSCLTKGQTELHEDDWLTLCHKLHLTEQSEELRSCIQKHKPEKCSISFQEFRTALLTLLGKSHEVIACTEKDFNIQQKGADPCGLESKRCDSTESNTNSDVLNIKTGVSLDENKSMCLWEKINSCLKDNVDSKTMYFISNCLGIPALPKQITQCIFEKLDQNCDGLISLDEFLVIFQNKKALQDQLTLDCNDEAPKSLNKSDPKKRNFDILASHKTSNSFIQSNNFLDMWKVAGINNTASLLTEGALEGSGIGLADLTTSLCDELKNLNDSLDHASIRSHITLLREVLILYQEEIHSLNLMIDNINGEKEKLRIDVVEANERANALAQEIDEQHMREEEIVLRGESLRKQIEQRHAEMIEDVSKELTSEREMNAAALRSKDEQIQMLQKENYEIRNKFVNNLQENQVLENENESLRTQMEKLKSSNNDLLTQIKALAAEHDETENYEEKQQEEIIFLIHRIKQLQSEAVLLRDQNDELTAKIETLRLRDSHVRDTRQNNIPGIHSRSIQQDDSEEKEGYVDDDADFDIFLKHTSTPCPTDSDGGQNYKRTELKNLKELVIKQLKNLLVNNNKCSSDNCVFREEISAIINRLELNLNAHSIKESDFAKSIAFELETECEERTSESLRDFVVPKHKNSVLKRVAATNSNNDVASDMEDSFGNQDSKTPQSKTPSLRDYPPRKEEHSTDQTRSGKENHSKTAENSLKSNSSSVRTESIEDVATANLKLQELEATFTAEKKQLTERCHVLERSLELLKAEYEECEDYWAAKLEEERQLFEQEQKISDEKFSELIAKMAEYEELIIPTDKSKNGGRLSPIEEKFNLEQQYLDLEEEFKKWRMQTEEDIVSKDRRIVDLEERMKNFERPAMIDTCVQATDDVPFSHLMMQSNYVPTSSFNISPSSDSSKLSQCNENVRKFTEEYKLDRILESSVLSNDFIARVTKEETTNDYSPHQIRTQYSLKEANITCKLEKHGGQRKKMDVGAKSSVLLKEEDKHENESIQDALRQQNFKMNCHCVRNDAQQQVCCVDVSILQNLNMKLQIQERKKRQWQEYFKRQQCHVEHVLHHIMCQHQIEVTELQSLLRNTQEKLQIQFQTSAEQAERLARADILVKDLYIENACLVANQKRLEERCHILMGFDSESTSI